MLSLERLFGGAAIGTAEFNSPKPTVDYVAELKMMAQRGLIYETGYW
jgi:hypothetical protein